MTMNQHALELLSLYLPPDRLAQVLSALKQKEEPQDKAHVLEWRALAKEQTALLFKDATLELLSFLHDHRYTISQVEEAQS